MDTDPFWVTGGWFIKITGSNFMAPAVPEASSTTRSQAILLFLGLFLFLIVPLLARPLDFQKKSMPSTAELHPQQTKHSSSSDAAAVSTTTISGSASGQQFKAAAHEVPSGPNPESNK